ncbi:MAG TPA: TonB family protein [Sphingopyxis sp.]|jgi:TonB family protein|nr:TonB family protein [Sphingopyxis sp.]
MTYAPPSDGKEDFFVRGIQGMVRVRVAIGTDGVLQDASVADSSRSPELDAFALGLVRRMTFQPAQDKDGRPVAVIAHFPMELWKDSAMDGTLFAKSCGDFLIDADWFQQTFPEKKPDELRSWLLLTGIFVAQRYSSGAKLEAGPNFQAVYAACRAKPKRKLVDIYKQLEK